MQTTHTITIVTAPAGAGKTNSIISEAIANLISRKTTIALFPTTAKVDEAYADIMNQLVNHRASVRNQVVRIHSKQQTTDHVKQVMIALTNASTNNQPILLLITHKMLEIIAPNLDQAFYNSMLFDEATEIFIKKCKKIHSKSLIDANHNTLIQVYDADQYVAGIQQPLPINKDLLGKRIVIINNPNQQLAKCELQTQLIEFTAQSSTSLNIPNIYQLCLNPVDHSKMVNEASKLDQTSSTFNHEINLIHEKYFTSNPLLVFKVEITPSIDHLCSPKTKVFTANADTTEFELLRHYGSGVESSTLPKFEVNIQPLQHTYNGNNKQVNVKYCLDSNNIGKTRLFEYSNFQKGSNASPDDLFQRLWQCVQREYKGSNGLLVTNTGAIVQPSDKWEHVAGDVKGLNCYRHVGCVAALFSFNQRTTSIVRNLEMMFVKSSPENIQLYRNIMNSEAVYQAVKRGFIRVNNNTNVEPYEIVVLNKDVAEFINKKLTAEKFTVQVSQLKGAKQAFIDHCKLTGSLIGRPRQYPSDIKAVRDFMAQVTSDAKTALSKKGISDDEAVKREAIKRMGALCAETSMLTPEQRISAFAAIEKYENNCFGSNADFDQNDTNFKGDL